MDNQMRFVKLGAEDCIVCIDAISYFKWDSEKLYVNLDNGMKLSLFDPKYKVFNQLCEVCGVKYAKK